MQTHGISGRRGLRSEKGLYMVGRYTLFKVFAGSLFVQSSWSFEKMQSLGFACAITPALRVLYAGDDAGLMEAQKRHMSFYNAHPYMASAVLGAAINLEEKALRSECRSEAALAFKKMVMAPYGAIGDAFFWGSLRPFASCAGVLSAFLWGFWGPVVFLLAYNAVHLWMRWHGLKKGYELGTGVVDYIKSLGLPGWGERLKTAGAATLGVFFAAAVTAGNADPYIRQFDGALRWAAFAGVAALFALSYLVLKRGVSLKVLFYAAVVPLVILMITGL